MKNSSKKIYMTSFERKISDGYGNYMVSNNRTLVIFAS